MFHKQQLELIPASNPDVVTIILQALAEGFRFAARGNKSCGADIEYLRMFS